LIVKSLLFPFPGVDEKWGLLMLSLISFFKAMSSDARNNREGDKQGEREREKERKKDYGISDTYTDLTRIS
jgi:hypothetical protein